MVDRKQLVTAHLEGVSWRVFAQYPDVVRDLIRGHAGVYALFKRDRLSAARRGVGTAAVALILLAWALPVGAEGAPAAPLQSQPLQSQPLQSL
jgi:hypothetical protein